IINIGIEGTMLAGAFFGWAAAYLIGSVAAGMLVAVGAALVTNALLAVLIVNLAVNQVVAGTALDILAAGLTGVFYRRMFGITGVAYTVTPIPQIKLGLLARIPLIGPGLFEQ